MNLLELRMNYSAFIKLREFVKINDISAEIKDYIKKDDVIIGKLEVNGSYLVEDLISTNTFSEEIPFNIIFTNDDFEIVDIDCIDLDYNVVDGRGIEVLFDILLKYEEFETREVESEKCESEEIIEDKASNVIEKDDSIEIPVLVEEETIYENIKEEKELEIDKMIKEELNEVIDNLPTEVEKEERKSTIKVCYYKESSDLDSVCFQNNVGIDKIFNDNKKTDFEKYRRVIIK